MAHYVSFPEPVWQFILLARRRENIITGREFLDTLAAGTAGITIDSPAKSYAQIQGANDRLNFAIRGLRRRGYAQLGALIANKDAVRTLHVCDVGSDKVANFATTAEYELGYAPVTEKEFHCVVAQKEVDAVTIATPDHWHTLAIAALQPGKHVY